MPELPDLAYVAGALSRVLVGRRIVGARTGDPTVLRMMLPGSFAEALVGRTLLAVERVGHFVRFSFDGDRVAIVNAMLVGKYRLLAAEDARRTRDPVAMGFAMTFDDGTELRYLDDKRMGKVYVAAVADAPSIPAFGNLGVDVMSPELDRARFGALVRRRRDQVRMFLMDKSALASIGNAYADEILFAAGIHPKTMVRKLQEPEVDRLYAAIRQVLGDAIVEIARRHPPIDVKVRDFLSVRGRDGQPCPRCGTTIRAVRVGDGDACFCPRCQPATRNLFVDWSRLPAGGAVREAPPTGEAEPEPGGEAEPGGAPEPAKPTASRAARRALTAAAPAAGGKARSRRRSPR
jgi:formamidopyrimidine-DNA glycosylase